MKIKGKHKLIKALSKLQDNCTGIRGNDGQRLSDQVFELAQQAEGLDVDSEEIDE